MKLRSKNNLVLTSAVSAAASSAVLRAMHLVSDPSRVIKALY